MLPQQMGADDMFDGALVELRSYDGSVKLILLRVWRKKFGNSKSILLQREVYVVRVHSMGGVGKQLWHWPSATRKRLKGLTAKQFWNFGCIKRNGSLSLKQ